VGMRESGSRRRRECRERGQSLVEFAMAIPIVLFLIFSTIEMARFYFIRISVRSAVAEAVRFAVTGNQLDDPMTGDPLSRAQSVRELILDRTQQFGVEGSDISIDPPDGGDPEEVVTVSLDFEYDVALPSLVDLFPDPLRMFTISSSMRNEPFFE